MSNWKMILLTMVLPLRVAAANVTFETAKAEALKFLQTKMKTAGSNHPIAFAEQAFKAEGNTYYVLNVENDGGFVIMAGDDRAPQVLGYSLEGNLNYQDPSCSVKTVLESYASQIEQLRQTGKVMTNALVQPQKPVPMLMKTQWGQDEPYNQHCDLFVSKAPTGCVATAMAQVLYYNGNRALGKVQTAIPGYVCRAKWTVEGTDETEERKLQVPAIAASAPIDWAHLRPVYSLSATTEEREAVAALMRYCGVAVETEYRIKESAANIWSVPVAMKKYFGYSEQVGVKSQTLMTSAEWAQLLIGELQAMRPVILSGETACGGHVFVCDGVDEQGLYHLNWGWSGLNNGYFVLMPFMEQPKELPVRFGSRLHAVVGLMPGDGSLYQEQLRLTTVGLAVGSIDKDKFLTARKPFTQKRNNFKLNVRFGFQLVQRNCTASTGDFESALAMYDKKGRFVKIIDHTHDDFKHFNKIQTKISSHAFDFGSMIKKGLFRIYPVSRKKGTEEWLMNDNGLIDNYIEVLFKAKEVTISLAKPQSDKKKKKKK